MPAVNVLAAALADVAAATVYEAVPKPASVYVDVVLAAAVAQALLACQAEATLPVLRIFCRILRLLQTEHRIVHKTFAYRFLPLIIIFIKPPPDNGGISLFYKIESIISSSWYILSFLLVINH